MKADEDVEQATLLPESSSDAPLVTLITGDDSRNGETTAFTADATLVTVLSESVTEDARPSMKIDDWMLAAYTTLETLFEAVVGVSVLRENEKELMPSATIAPESTSSSHMLKAPLTTWPLIRLSVIASVDLFRIESPEERIDTALRLLTFDVVVQKEIVKLVMSWR